MNGDAPLVPEGIEKVQIDKAIQAIHQKKPVPEIDFTLHTMEDGSQVSTMERVCKGTVQRKYLFIVTNRKLTKI
jgi:hypothetical protein